MRHKSDFPALSDSVTRIQSMARSDTESVGSVTNEILKDVALTNKLLRMVNTAHFSNAGGGNIGKLQGGYIPQAHDRLALVNFGRRPWVEYMMEPGRLDRARTVDQFSGQPLSDSQLRRALETAWDRITTDGFYDADVTAQPQGKGALYTQHMDHRFIHFNGPDKWMEYSKRFGNGGDVYAAMMGHIQIMARDIAHMEVFGPNPNRTRALVGSLAMANLSQFHRADGAGYARIPGLYSAEQVDAWKPVTKAVHDHGGRIFAQLMHTGRVTHVANLPAGAEVVGPVDGACPGEMYMDALGMQPHSPARAMTEADIAHAVAEYAQAARLAIEAGFDGIELHAANGYLIEQFLKKLTAEVYNGLLIDYGGSHPGTGTLQ